MCSANWREIAFPMMSFDDGTFFSREKRNDCRPMTYYLP